MYRLESTEFNVVSSSQVQVELSFRSTYNPSRQDSVRLNVDKRWHIHYSDYTSIYFDIFLSSEMVPNSHWNLLPPKKKTVSSDLWCWKAAPGSTATPSLGTPVTGLPWTFQRLGSLSNSTRTSEYPFFFRHWWPGIYLNLSQDSLDQADFFSNNKLVLGSTTWRFQTTYSDTCPAQQTEMNLMVLHWPTKRLSCSLTPRSHSSRERSIAQTCLTYSTRTS